MKKNWGGSWTIQKLEAFEDYVSAYLTIMHNTRKKHNGWPQEIIYFDGFAGSGKKENNNDDEQKSLFEEMQIDIQEQNVYKGSAERVLGLDKKFDKYIFVDFDENAISSLKKSLEEKKLSNKNCYYIVNDINVVINHFINKFNPQKSALVFLDPFGMQVNWENIEKMKDKRIDLWILLPSGVIINRLLDRKGQLIHSEKLEKHLGISEKQIKQIFYKTTSQPNLFGEDETIVNKKSNIIHKIAEVYIQKLKTIFKHVTQPLELKNSRNVTIYHFIFASNNKTAFKIASQIIEKKNKK